MHVNQLCKLPHKKSTRNCIPACQIVQDCLSYERDKGEDYLKRTITKLQNKLIDMVMLKNERSESYQEVVSKIKKHERNHRVHREKNRSSLCSLWLVFDKTYQEIESVT